MPQLERIISGSAVFSPYRKCPYQAKVMKRLEMMRSTMGQTIRKTRLFELNEARKCTASVVQFIAPNGPVLRHVGQRLDGIGVDNQREEVARPRYPYIQIRFEIILRRAHKQDH